MTETSDRHQPEEPGGPEPARASRRGLVLTLVLALLGFLLLDLAIVAWFIRH